MRWSAVVLTVVVGCVDSDAVECGGGRVCPGGTICAPVTDPDDTLCAVQEQLDACEAAPRYQACTTSKIETGRCYDGVCLPIGCGNGRVDRADPSVAGDQGESCDDGDQVAGNGCAADCTSDETCGNGVVDVVKLEGCDDGNLLDHDRCDSTCRAETPGWTPRSTAQPPLLALRTGTAMVYDVAHDQFVLFGGVRIDLVNRTQTTFGDTWLWDGKGWIEAGAVEAPSPRYGHRMAYDSDRHRVVLFGGTDEANLVLSDTWEWDGTRWRRVFSSQSPPARSAHGMAYDAKRKRVVVFGGIVELLPNVEVSPVERPDTWLWDGATWVEQTTTEHPTCTQVPNGGRSAAAMAYDESRGVTVLFGGECHGFVSGGLGAYASDDEVWELDSSGWHTVGTTAARPPSTAGDAMAFSPASRRVMMFGSPGEHWEWNGSAWTELSPSQLPDPREGAIAADPEHGRVLLVGGALAGTDPGVWSWDGTQWSAPAMVVPGLANAVAAYDLHRQVGVVVDMSNDTFELVGTSWRKTAMVGTSLGAAARAIAYDEARRRSVLLISVTGGSETWIWDGTTWTDAAPPAGPVPRYGFAMAYDGERKQVVMYGGADTSGESTGETWTWDGTTWTQQQPAHTPPTLFDHSMAYDRSHRQIVLFGGQHYVGAVGSFSNIDTWLWDGSDWTQAPAAPGPSSRDFASIAWDPARQRLLMFGGYAGIIGLNDIWEWNESRWELVATSISPSVRGEAMMLPERDGGGLWMFGGYQRPPLFGISHVPLLDGWRFRWQSDGRSDSCSDRLDFDGDTRAGCADADCWSVCSPLCAPGPEQTTCAMAAPNCGDSACNGPQETCRSCPEDCGACTPACGDSYCEGSETATSCPGDC